MAPPGRDPAAIVKDAISVSVVFAGTVIDVWAPELYVVTSAPVNGVATYVDVDA
jgi:hypothetical protein